MVSPAPATAARYAPSRLRRRREAATATAMGPAPTATAVVTGASSGIGAAFARVLAERGHPLVLVARDRSALERLAADLPGPATVVVADLATSEGLDRVEGALTAAEPPARLLVNNAGSAVHGALAEQAPDAITTSVLLNVLAPTRLTAAALRAMPPDSAVINISSTAVDADAPGIGVYAAGKAHLETLSRTARREARARRIAVVVVRPGWTRTAFHERSREDVSHVPAAQWQAPDDVARAALAALDAGRHCVTVVPPDRRPLPRRVAGHLWQGLRSRLARH